MCNSVVWAEAAETPLFKGGLALVWSCHGIVVSERPKKKKKKPEYGSTI